MKTKTFSELKSEASDNFSFILVFCPNWPSALKQINTAKVFNNMIDLINAISEQTKGDDTKQWLLVCLQEVRQSWKHYEDGNRSAGRKLIQRAEEHFKNAFSKKPIEARFIAGESGAAFDSEKGIPE
jgi:hypothetical protein